MWLYSNVLLDGHIRQVWLYQILQKYCNYLIYIGGAKCKDAQEGSDCFNSFIANCPGGNILPSYETDCICALNHKGGRCCVSKP
jgi:hypothetical protein